MYAAISKYQDDNIADESTTTRVAQNTISHQTICNISAISGLIFKILEAA